MRIALSLTIIEDGGVLEEVEGEEFLCGESSLFKWAAASEETDFWLPFVISWTGWFSATEDVDWINTGSFVRPILILLRMDGVRIVFELRERLRWVCLGFLYSCDKEFFKTFLPFIQCVWGYVRGTKSGWPKKGRMIDFFFNWNLTWVCRPIFAISALFTQGKRNEHAPWRFSFPSKKSKTLFRV